jgi:hypothetical protein
MPPLAACVHNGNLRHPLVTDNSPPVSPSNEETRNRPYPPQRDDRKVTFRDSVRVRWIEEAKTLSPEQREALYYSKVEFKIIRLDVLFELEKLLERGVFPESYYENDDACIRGLEKHLLPPAQNQKFQEARKLVFREQRFQKSYKRPDEIYMATVYSIHSESSVDEAIEIAEQDAIEAQQYYNED